ncbi:hypothetical protein QAD02_000327 [Eretmocerus hayati]|uniref:Uncharacterized protein n=1 Tax=Eretmocerus hayati TaxID=131215 RepID=A0ACC2ND76_9HYME|nr:hypothetical protein QAD02_000327 [Eretmocerus hayati]
MAGETASSLRPNNESGQLEGEKQPHSTAGGIPTQPPGNSINSNAKTTPEQHQSNSSSTAMQVCRPRVPGGAASAVVDGLCRYASDGMSFFEVCQIRVQQLFPKLSPPQKSTLCEDSIELTAECLANDVMRYLLKEDLCLISRDPISRSMRHNVYQMLNKHSILFTSMVNRLNVVPDTAYEAFMGVADELFHQGITWARIVCLYAFMGRLALWARDRRMHTLKQKLPLFVSRYIGEEITQFIKVYGGWEQLCIEYPVTEEVSGAVWRSLLMTGATLGLVATILSVTS